jgi:hypothetical protein
MLNWFLRRLRLRCSFGCSDAVVGVYWFNEGCAARPKQRLQCLCAQHVVSAEPVGRMRCLAKLFELESWKNKGAAVAAPRSSR